MQTTMLPQIPKKCKGCTGSTHSLPALLASVVLNEEAVDVTDAHGAVQVRLLQQHLALLGCLLLVLLVGPVGTNHGHRSQHTCSQLPGHQKVGEGRKREGRNKYHYWHCYFSAQQNWNTQLPGHWKAGGREGMGGEGEGRNATTTTTATTTMMMIFIQTTHRQPTCVWRPCTVTPLTLFHAACRRTRRVAGQLFTLPWTAPAPASASSPRCCDSRSSASTPPTLPSRRRWNWREGATTLTS